MLDELRRPSNRNRKARVLACLIRRPPAVALSSYELLLVAFVGVALNHASCFGQSGKVRLAEEH